MEPAIPTPALTFVLGSQGYEVSAWGLEKRVMNRDKPNDTTPAFPVLSIFRGLYQRVAAKLGVDPSYVSRVARGERKSALVLAALQEEMNVIREHLNQQLVDGNARDGQANGDVADTTLSDGQYVDGQSAKGKSAKSMRRTAANGRDARAAD